MDPTLQLQQQVNDMANELADLHYLVSRKTGLGSADIKGRVTGTITVSDGSITTAKLATSAATKQKISYETVTLAFGSGDISKTATVTSGSIVIGVYSSVVTSTPAYGELQLSVSSTTLTGTRSAAPGGVSAITYTVILLKAI